MTIPAVRNGSISASAEEPSTPTASSARTWVDLRERGGAVTSRATAATLPGRSPRARRSRIAGHHLKRPVGSISASAEEPDERPVFELHERVDLRERGGADCHSSRVPSVTGRSPRARRSPAQIGSRVKRHRSISASAEEPRNTARFCPACRVDLRERGGAPSVETAHQSGWGRSPRARRSHSSQHLRPLRLGSISAGAEEPSRPRARHPTSGVDLRERGGANLHCAFTAHPAGRSPRARRSPRTGSARRTGGGSISASAEEPPPRCERPELARVDLRERGGAAPANRCGASSRGRSPRARRSPEGAAGASAGGGSISASAEEPTRAFSPSCKTRVDLRERGGAASAGSLEALAAGRSPRARRSHSGERMGERRCGSISASAEEPECPGLPGFACGVDLRERGGATHHSTFVPFAWGRSPRARRSPRRDAAVVVGAGSISASAEEPPLVAHCVGAPRVDLRERGGAAMICCTTPRSVGRSPRARRSPARGAHGRCRRGSISASAEGAQHGDGAGRSPRARRSRHEHGGPLGHHGSISASAEEPNARAEKEGE